MGPTLFPLSLPSPDPSVAAALPLRTTPRIPDPDPGAPPARYPSECARPPVTAPSAAVRRRRPPPRSVLQLQRGLLRHPVESIESQLPEDDEGFKLCAAGRHEIRRQIRRPLSLPGDSDTFVKLLVSARTFRPFPATSASNQGHGRRQARRRHGFRPPLWRCYVQMDSRLRGLHPDGGGVPRGGREPIPASPPPCPWSPAAQRRRADIAVIN